MNTKQINLLTREKSLFIQCEELFNGTITLLDHKLRYRAKPLKNGPLMITIEYDKKKLEVPFEFLMMDELSEGLYLDDVQYGIQPFTVNNGQLVRLNKGSKFLDMPIAIYHLLSLVLSVLALQIDVMVEDPDAAINMENLEKTVAEYEQLP